MQSVSANIQEEKREYWHQESQPERYAHSEQFQESLAVRESHGPPFSREHEGGERGGGKNKIQKPLHFRVRPHQNGQRRHKHGHRARYEGRVEKPSRSLCIGSRTG